jgi:hypothetical protein
MNRLNICLKILLLMNLTSCTSLYLEEFDSPVHEGVRNYSLTDLERSIVEMPGNQQDVLVVVPKTNEISCSCSINQFSTDSSKVWICQQRDCYGNLEDGHYKVFNEEKVHAID